LISTYPGWFCKSRMLAYGRWLPNLGIQKALNIDCFGAQCRPGWKS
jgi:hypothetical protein